MGTINQKRYNKSNLKLFQNLDWGFLLLVLFLLIVGLVALYSAVYSSSDTDNRLQNSLYVKQFVWIGGGCLIMVFSLFFQYKLLDTWAYPIYFLCILFLIFVIFNGKLVAGSRRWLSLGPFTFQPSEMAKISIVILLAKYYSHSTLEKGFTLKELIIPFIYICIPSVLILKQPDLGTSMLIFLIAGTLTMFMKIQRRSLIILLIGLLTSIPLVWFGILKPYQKERIMNFIDPGRDPLGSGYHIIQSKIAIGSGMLYGKGFMKGTQNDLSFLPEQHTDFIFSVFAEEWGFIGSVVIIFLYLFLISWSLTIASSSKDSFGKILAVGVSIMIFWQVVINIGMTMGLMPVVGVPLPFMSYGGSCIITTLVGVSILLNIRMRRLINNKDND